MEFMNVTTPQNLDLTSMRPARVTQDDLDRQLSVLQQTVKNPNEGLFGPGSITWRVDKEAILFMGAARAALLQVAHPWVAEAIAQQSRTKTDPIGRFHRTFTIMFAMNFGSLDHSMHQARRLHAIHSHISGELSETTGPFAQGSPYYANDVAAMLWVHATLVETALMMYELVCPPLSPSDKEAYYSASKQKSRYFGLDPAWLPDTWADFQRYNRQMHASEILTVGSAAKDIASFLILGKADGRRTFVPLPGWYRAITARVLPERIRDQYGLPFSVAEERTSETALRWIRRVYFRLPRRFRYVPPYHEALGRLQGRQRPDFLTRNMNRIWVGRPQLVS